MTAKIHVCKYERKGGDTGRDVGEELRVQKLHVDEEAMKTIHAVIYSATITSSFRDCCKLRMP